MFLPLFEIEFKTRLNARILTLNFLSDLAKGGGAEVRLTPSPLVVPLRHKNLECVTKKTKTKITAGFQKNVFTYCFRS